MARDTLSKKWTAPAFSPEVMAPPPAPGHLRPAVAAALTSRGFDGTRASLLLADEQGVLRTVLGHHDDYDRVREKLLVARKVALGVAVGR